MAHNYHQTGQGIVIGHWSLVKRLRKERLRKGEKETGERRQETVSAIKIIRSNLPLRHQEYYTGFRVCDLEFEIWDFTHLPVLGELGGLFFQDREK